VTTGTKSPGRQLDIFPTVQAAITSRGRGQRPPDGKAAANNDTSCRHNTQEEAAMSVLRFEPFRDPFERLISMAATGTRAPLGMPMDVYRAEDGSYHVEADLPGADPDTVEVTIRAERTPHYGESEQVIVAERPQGSFTRLLTLGEGVDSENLTAGYADGVLHVTNPASPKAQARRVEVARGSGGSRTISDSTAGRVRRVPETRAPAPAERPCAQFTAVPSSPPKTLSSSTSSAPPAAPPRPASCPTTPTTSPAMSPAGNATTSLRQIPRGPASGGPAPGPPAAQDTQPASR
jgi:HSP20 family protein